MRSRSKSKTTRSKTGSTEWRVNPMPTDDERREVARRLRELDHSDLQESLICAYLDALGIKGYEDWIGIAHRLADLIEPSEPKVMCVAEVKVDGEQLERLVHDAAVELTGIDRDALLKLADEIEYGAGTDDGEYKDMPGFIVAAIARQEIAYARRIREACGEVER